MSDAVPNPAGTETNRWLVLVLVCIAQFMVILDATIVNVALPSIQNGLHFSATSLQWVVNAYALVFGGFLLLGGRASDLLGRQRLFIAGVIVFTVASLINGIATSSGVLIGGRALQGLGAALVSPAALSIVTTTFAEGKERTKALGVWSAIAAGGGAFGLIIGGLLTETLSWRWVFFVNIPIGIAAALLSLRFIPNSKSEEKPHSADVAGAVTVTGGLLLLVYAIVKAQTYGWGDLKTFGLFAGAIVLLGSFVAIELRSRSPLIRLGIFRLRSLTSSNLSMLLVASGMFSMFYFASIYVQEILGYGPLKAGFAFLPFTFGIVIGAGAAQALISRIGIRAVTASGLTIATIGLAFFTQVSVTGTYWSEIFPGVAIMSIGMGLTFVPLTLLATTNISNADAGLASGIFNTSQQIGGALGLALLTTLSTNKTEDELASLGREPTGVETADALVSGFHLTWLASAILLAAGGLLLLALLRRRDVVAVAEGEVAPVVA
jgi:EmrB/QacA subfamily drug resistance transporter